MCFDFLNTLNLKQFSSQEEFSALLSQTYIGLHVKCPSFFSDLNETWMSTTERRKILEHQISRKSEWEQSYFMRANRRTDDMTKFIVVFFRNSANARKELVVASASASTTNLDHWRVLRSVLHMWCDYRTVGSSINGLDVVITIRPWLLFIAFLTIRSCLV